MGETGPIHVVAIDDHELARLGMAWLVAHGAGLHLAGTAASARQALALVERVRPGVATIGTDLPDQDGLSLGGTLRERYPDLGLVLVLAEPDPTRVAAAARRGLSGAVPRTASVTTLTAVIRAAAADPHTFRAPGEFLRSPTRPSPRLSPRERQGPPPLVEGRNPPAVAARAGISPATAQTPVARPYTKLHAPNPAPAPLARAGERP